MTSNDEDMEGSPAAHDAHLKVELSNREAGPLRASTKSSCTLPPVKDSEEGSAGIAGGNAANESETRLKNGNEIGCAIRPALFPVTSPKGFSLGTRTRLEFLAQTFNLWEHRSYSMEKAISELGEHGGNMLSSYERLALIGAPKGTQAGLRLQW
jgi:hypothetical protein